MTQKIGRFEIRRELGRGAQSVVDLAWDPQLQRDVAPAWGLPAPILTGLAHALTGVPRR